MDSTHRKKLSPLRPHCPPGIAPATWQKALEFLADAPGDGYLDFLFIWAKACRCWRSLARTGYCFNRLFEFWGAAR